jgi:hypothetical protein
MDILKQQEPTFEELDILLSKPLLYRIIAVMMTMMMIQYYKTNYC